MLFKKKFEGQEQKPKVKLFVGIILILLGLMGLIGAAIIYIEQPKQPNLKLAKSVGVSIPPSSIKPSAKVIASYNVPPTDPKYISIPAIHINDVPVLKLGLMGDGAIATPDNIYDAGWYKGSSEPGQPGAMFIYGHVSSWTADGVFYNLKKLALGDKVTITRGDNVTYTYSVVTSKVYPYNRVAMSQVLSPISTSTPGLNLMTCTGNVISGTSEFNERLVVFTRLVSN
jgi:LPXTG-site transpeptidase (sortase) family protein